MPLGAFCMRNQTAVVIDLGAYFISYQVQYDRQTIHIQQAEEKKDKANSNKSSAVADGRPFGHNTHGPKIGGRAHFGGI